MLGAVALVYASWEAYIERVAVEVTTYLASTLPPAAVPSTARACISNAAVPWDLVGDGWRTRWTEVVTRLAIGSGPNDFGLNTAGPRQVVHLFEAVGLSPFDKVSWQKMNSASVKKKLASLVRDRGRSSTQVSRRQASDSTQPGATDCSSSSSLHGSTVLSEVRPLASRERRLGDVEAS